MTSLLPSSQNRVSDDESVSIRSGMSTRKGYRPQDLIQDRAETIERPTQSATNRCGHSLRYLKSGHSGIPQGSKMLYEAEIEVSAVWRGGTYQPLMISSARRPFFSCSIPPGISSEDPVARATRLPAESSTSA